MRRLFMDLQGCVSGLGFMLFELGLYKLKIVRSMSLLDEEDEEEGFFPHQITIIQKKRQSRHQQRRPCDYQPRVLLYQPIHQKLPIEINQMFTQINNNDIQQMLMTGFSLKTNRKSPSQPKSPYDFYKQQNKFDLAYTKYSSNPLIKETDNFARRQIFLGSLVRYQEQNYSELKDYQQIENPKQIHTKNMLIFDSKFQGGNLHCVFRNLKDPNEYHCFIENDTNTNGYNQWFYFSLKGVKKDTKYRFLLVNLRKKYMFYKDGMKPVIFSLARHREKGNGWQRKGDNIDYSASQIYDVKYGKKSKLYCLTFQLTFDYDDDFITISACLPYSYSKLISQLKKYKTTALYNDIYWQQRTIAYTISNNQVPYLIISKINPNELSPRKKKSKKQELEGNYPSGKKIIILLARQHPGETNSSYLMDEVLNVLSKNFSHKSQWMLQRFQFRIFPMINVDGVIYGNFRCDLAGFDPNRSWKRPMKEIHTQIYAIKQQILKLSVNNKILFCIDLHSHSKQYNIFSYCSKHGQGQSRLFSYMLSNSTPLFHFPYCRFGLSKGMQSTARGVIASIVRHYNVITIECSYFAAKKKDKVTVIEPKHYNQMANAIIDSFKSYFSNDKYKLSQMKQVEINLSELLEYGKNDQDGSDSEAEIDTEDFQSKMARMLPPQLFAAIKKRIADEDRAQEASAREAEKQQTIEISQPEQPSPRKEQDISPKKSKNIRIMKKRKSEEPNNEFNVIINRNSELARQSQDKEIMIQEPFHPLNWTKHRRTKTSPKKEVNLEQNYNLVVKDSNTGSSLLDDYEFKRSMKLLYNQLKSSRNEELWKRPMAGESSLILERSGRVQGEKKPISTFKRLSNIEKILKVRRKASTFKTCEPERPMQDDNNLMKIKSQDYSIESDRKASYDQRDNSVSVSELMARLNVPIISKIFKNNKKGPKDKP